MDTEPFQLIVRVVCAALVGLAATSGHAQNAIAHWSFDSSTVTTGVGGRIETASDDTGLHNSTAVYGGTGVNITSVAGQFGQAAMFGNNAGADAVNFGFFQFPQLGEIDGPDGGDFTVAAWVTTTQTTRSNPVLATWIQGGVANNLTYLFSLANVDVNSAARPHIQLRSSNNPNDDIVESTLHIADSTLDNVANALWHHIAWTWKKDNKTMYVYVDGVQSDAIVSADANVDILASTSPFGHIGSKRDTHEYFRGSLDELWVFDTALNVFQVNNLMAENRLDLNLILGDTDGDGVPGEFPDDFNPIRNNFRKLVTLRTQGDLVRDGVVDFNDFGEWKNAFLGASGGSLGGIDFDFLVPEPATCIMLILVAPLLAAWVRQRQPWRTNRSLDRKR